MERDSSVGVATRYGLDGPGFESRRGRDFPHLSIPALGSTQSPVQWIPGLSLGIKRPGRGVDHPLSSSVEVTERVELYFYSTSGPSWPIPGWPLPLPYQNSESLNATRWFPFNLLLLYSLFIIIIIIIIIIIVSRTFVASVCALCASLQVARFRTYAGYFPRLFHGS